MKQITGLFSGYVSSLIWGTGTETAGSETLTKNPATDKKVTTIFTNSNVTNPCWNQLQITNQDRLIAGEKKVVQSFFTNFSKQITPANSRTIDELGVYIQTVSWYGARPWNNLTWFSSFDNNNTVGLLSLDNTALGKSQYLPLNGLSNMVIPLIIPSHSVEGENGYACVYEAQLGLAGFSLWNINSANPTNLFSQEGFESVIFIGNSDVIAFREEGSVMEWWDLETKSKKFALTGWYQDGGVYMTNGPFNSKENILLADSGHFIFGFDLNSKKYAYTIYLQGQQDGVGVFHKVLVGNDSFYTREYSSPLVDIFDIKTGKSLHSFKVGGASDGVSTDDYPMCVYGDYIFALSSDDRKIVCMWNAKTGEIEKTFEPASQNISGLYVTEGRLIASCLKGATGANATHDQAVIWDMNTAKQLKVINGDEGYNMWPQDITDGKITFFVDKINNNKLKGFKDLSLKQAKLEIKNDTSLQDNIHWQNPQFLQLLNNSIKLDIWDTESCAHLGSIQEDFTAPSGNFPLLANYDKGRLVVDNSGSVLIQNFNT